MIEPLAFPDEPSDDLLSQSLFLPLLLIEPELPTQLPGTALLLYLQTLNPFGGRNSARSGAAFPLLEPAESLSQVAAPFAGFRVFHCRLGEAVIDVHPERPQKVFDHIFLFGVVLRWLSPGAEYRLSRVTDASSSCFGESRNYRQEKAAHMPKFGEPCGQRMVVVPFSVSQVGTQ